MQPDLEVLAGLIDETVKLVIVNSPNNPSGAVLTEESLRGIAALLTEAERKYGRTIYLLSDEPYRELVFDGRALPCAAEFYDNTVVCYSYSKSLSLPGERLGYLAVSGRMEDREAVFDAIAGGARLRLHQCAQPDPARRRALSRRDGGHGRLCGEPRPAL